MLIRAYKFLLYLIIRMNLMIIMIIQKNNFDKRWNPSVAYGNERTYQQSPGPRKSRFIKLERNETSQLQPFVYPIWKVSLSLSPEHELSHCNTCEKARAIRVSNIAKTVDTLQESYEKRVAIQVVLESSNS